MSSKLESDVCCCLQVAPSGESYGGNCRPGRKKWQPTARSIWHDSLHVTCGLTACTLGSALGPTLGNEYGKTLPFTFYWLTQVVLEKRPLNGHSSVRGRLTHVDEAGRVEQCAEVWTGQ